MTTNYARFLNKNPSQAPSAKRPALIWKKVFKLK